MNQNYAVLPSIRIGFFSVRALFLALTMVTLGCQRASEKKLNTKPSEVIVSHPTVQEVTDYEYFIGRMETVRGVEIRARVTGYLDAVHFKDGADVKQGDLLFDIDPRIYQAELDRADAGVKQAEAHLKRLNTDLQRAKSLLPNKSISREEYDKIVGDRDEADAALANAKASFDLAKLNLGFTKVSAPFSGRLSRKLIDPGNLVKADETPLTTIVMLDPIHAYFDIDERSVLRFRRMIREGKIRSARQSEVKVQLGLADEEGFSLTGTIDFIDNKVDPNTGTLRLRAVIPNPRSLLSPGLFVRLRLPVGDPHSATLVPEEAVGADQGKKFLYVVNRENEVAYRPVTVGALHNGMRVIQEGATPADLVIVSGLQRVRPGVTVTPKLIKSAPPAADSPVANGAGAVKP